MPSEYSTFGVVPADIGRYLPRIAFSVTTQPTDTQAQAIINDHAADLCGFLIGMGVSITTLSADPDATMYRNCQRYILMRFAAQVLRSRQQNSDTMADRLDDEAKQLRAERVEREPVLVRISAAKQWRDAAEAAARRAGAASVAAAHLPQARGVPA
jgi:hypothetical protein